MHPTTTSSPPPPLTQTLSLINHLVSLLLISSLAVKSFIGRWQSIRTKLTLLSSSLSEISDFDTSTWSENPLLQDLLPNLLSSLHKTYSLSQQCQNPTSTGGKLLMQSDIDMSSASLSAHLHDIDLLLKSGVLNRQSNAIVLSQPGPGSAKEELGFFIRDLFTRLQIGGIEFKKKALDSLLQILNEDEKSSILVAKEGDMRYLIHLLDNNHHSSVREQAAVAVSLLVSSSDSSRKCVFEEGGLGPLLRLLETGSMYLKEKAAIAIEAITADPENSWAVSAYGGIPVLVETCRSGSPLAQTHAVGAVKNVSAIDEIRVSLAEEGIVPVLVQLLTSGNSFAQEKASNCLWILASAGEDFRVSILQEGGLQSLLNLLDESSNPDTLEHVLRSIYILSRSSSTIRILSSSTSFLLQLCDAIKNGTIVIQQISASILCNLSMSDFQKRSISSCMGSLVKMMMNESSKPVGLQESSAQALISLLTAKTNRKEIVRDEKSILRLVQMLDPKNESSVVNKKYPVSVVSAIVAGSSQSCRNKIMSAGGYSHLQKLAEMDVPGARKACQRLSGNRLKNIFSSRIWKE
ncbi:vacuolar protein 8-like [Papaver somniferum]|uniref:vacuolar protein 8-like n=1 Tax=Papaver somniferum TaxID=3469 RepID=UPI000E6F9C23|nr:vacuolar protein 8-like [Papaver somniferum]XP_026409479.1 vacuolar protein 8-like [Papaver somniferum]XP_026409480.1 vacuolar protein 8-like [Papaver somniferum]